MSSRGSLGVRRMERIPERDEDSSAQRRAQSEKLVFYALIIFIVFIYLRSLKRVSSARHDGPSGSYGGTWDKPSPTLSAIGC